MPDQGPIVTSSAPRITHNLQTSEAHLDSPKASKHPNILKRIQGAESSLQLVECDQELQDELLEASLEKYYLHLQQLDDAKAHLDLLLSNTTATLTLLSEITSSFKDVEIQTSTFQQKSEGLLAEQQQRMSAADGIQDGLQYFEPLERITRRLNGPRAGTIVRSRDFPEMLLQLDQCIDYMQTHPEQAEAETYRARYQQLLTRALTLLRTQFVGSVKGTSAEVARRIADKQLNDTTMSTLLYAKFRVGAAEMKDLGLEIQKRTNPPADAEPGTEGEYQSLMNELHTNFAVSRSKLMVPLVRTKLAEISLAPSTSKDLVVFARSSISYIRGICLDEFELWGEWFHGQRGLYDFLESICEPLYDQLRPRIIREVKLPRLCQLCTLLQTRYINEGEDEYEPPDITELDFAFLIQPALVDTQSRIVFRAQTILRDEIERYKPNPGDLDYPARLRSQKAPTSGRRTSLVKDSSNMPPEGFDKTLSAKERWPLSEVTAASGLSAPYPTLGRTISLLSLIYRLLNPTIFDDLAHRIVHATTISLIHASTLLKAHKNVQPKSTHRADSDVVDTTANAQLFLLTHLMLLKSQIIAFDIEFYPEPEMSFDFSNLTNTFYEFQAERGGLFNPLNLVRLVGKGRDLLPRVVENMLDAKSELDGELRRVISDFTSWEAGKMTSALKIKGSYANEEKAGKAVADVRNMVEQEMPLLKRRLEEWIADERTRQTLLMAVNEAMGQNYEDYLRHFEGAMRPRGKSKTKPTVKGKGKGREDEVWDAETFFHWTQSIFAIPEDDEDTEGGGSRSLSRNGSA